MRVSPGKVVPRVAARELGHGPAAANLCSLPPGRPAVRRPEAWYRQMLTGAYRLLRRCVHLNVTHLMLLTEHDIRAGHPPIANLRLCTLNADAVRRFADAPAAALDPQLADRLELGRDVCVAALDGDTLAAYAWYGLDSIEAEHNRGRSVHTGTAVSFPPHMAFLYNAFTREEYRGRGLYQQLNRYARTRLRRHGVTDILSTADWTNRAALHSCYALGFRYLGTIWRWRIAGCNGGAYPRLDDAMGICMGRRARVTPRVTICPDGRAKP